MDATVKTYHVLSGSDATLASTLHSFPTSVEKVPFLTITRSNDRLGARSCSTRVAITLALHSIPLLLYIALLVIWALQLEQNLSPNPTLVNAIAHIFIMLLCVAMVTIFQPLAIRNYTQSVRTLTALSDYTSAWNGLGASLYAFYQNVHLPASMLPVFAITVYFASIAGLQATTPLLFTFPLKNETNIVSLNMTVGSPRAGFSDTLQQLLSSPANMSFSSVLFDWNRASTVLSFLDDNLASDTFGVANNTVYDTPTDSAFGMNGSVSVNRTEFRVSCGQLPQALNVSHTVTQDQSLFLSFVYTDDNGESVNVTDSVINRGSGHGVRIPQSQSPIRAMSRSLLLYYLMDLYDHGILPPLQLRDAKNSSGVVTSLGPLSDFSPFSGFSPITLSLQVINCALTVLETTGTLNLATNHLLEPTSKPASTSTWDGAVRDSGSDDGLLAGWWPAMFQPQSTIALPEAPGWKPRLVHPCTTTDSAMPLKFCHPPTLIETYLNDAISGLQDSWLDAEDPATLANLERALERATAVMALSGARANAVTMYAVGSGATATTFDNFVSQGVTMQTYEATGQRDILVSRLMISEVPLLLGAISSVALLVVTAVILFAGKSGAGVKDGASVPLDGVSLLQVTSLDTSHVAARLADVDANDAAARRRAGMFLVTVVDGRLVPVEGEVAWPVL